MQEELLSLLHVEECETKCRTVLKLIENGGSSSESREAKTRGLQNNRLGLGFQSFGKQVIRAAKGAWVSAAADSHDHHLVPRVRKARRSLKVVWLGRQRAEEKAWGQGPDSRTTTARCSRARAKQGGKAWQSWKRPAGRKAA